MNFNENLFMLRRRDNLSQEELAEKLGVTRQAVSKWESAQSSPDLDKIVEMCKIFNVSADNLLGLSDCPSSPEERPSAVQPKKRSFNEFTPSLFWLILFLAGFILFTFLVFGDNFDSGLYHLSLAIMFIPFLVFLVRTVISLLRR